jgi:hypothetical protein
MRSNAPTKGDMGYVWPKGKQVANGDEKSKGWKIKAYVQQIMNKCGKDVQNTETGAPV